MEELSQTCPKPVLCTQSPFPPEAEQGFLLTTAQEPLVFPKDFPKEPLSASAPAVSPRLGRQAPLQTA